MTVVYRLLLAAATLIILPPLLLLTGAALLLTDMAWRLLGRRHSGADTLPDRSAASIVIPNWNGRDLLERYLPTVVAATAGNPRHEIIVVENASTDGSADYVRQHFPQVRLLEQPRNLGFGGGSNAGFRAARNDIVVLLNSDMRVAPDFLAPLLEGFHAPDVFAVSCQIQFTDPAKLREETGLTQGYWEDGALRVRHRLDDAVRELFPCLYPGGGSSAFDRRKFLALGGFDHLLRPFYAEDTDLGYMAWKRGWRCYYQPASVVWHEHRGTIGRRFSRAYIDATVEKNFVLLLWKNLHDPLLLAEHFAFALAGSLLSALAGPSPERYSLAGILRAFTQLPEALRARWCARSRARVSDLEALRRPLGGYFRDRFHGDFDATRPRVLFLSPYPIEPPVHGGAVFMGQTIRELSRHAQVHLVTLLDHHSERTAHAQLETYCASAEYLVRLKPDRPAFATRVPHAVAEFANRDLEWLLHRKLYQDRIDAFQIEYTNMGQYAGDFGQIATCLFEHDIYFQSVGRLLAQRTSWTRRVKPAIEYLRALHWELDMLARVDRIQVCTLENAATLRAYAPQLGSRIDPGLRAGIDTSRYPFTPEGRTPETMLFLGSFRHLPNRDALLWFIQEVAPRIFDHWPEGRLIVAGADPPPRHSLPDWGPRLEIRGSVPSVQEALREPAVFVCPVLSGSGVRVKLLEAFAMGIPVVSTRIGAEGLAREHGEFCRLAHDAPSFAAQVIDLLGNPDPAMVLRARREVETNWDMRVITQRLAERYRETILTKQRRRRSQSDKMPA